jgi:hypothetical protein
MELALDVFAQSEEARLNTLKDSLRRMVVVETSLLMNRQYDLGHIPKVTEEVSVVQFSLTVSPSMILLSNL